MVALTPLQLMLLIIVGIAVALSVFTIIVVALSIATHKENPVKDRLLELKGGSQDDTEEVTRDPLEIVKEELIQFSEPLSRTLYGNSTGLLDQTKNLLRESGLPDSERHVWRFMAVRVATGITFAVAGFIGGLAVTQELNATLMVAIGAALLGLMVPHIMLRKRGEKRKIEIRYTLPDTLDFMVICVEAGLGLDSALLRVAQETRKMAPDISHELRRVNRDLNAGVTRIEAFQNLGVRSGVEELKSLCALIIQSDKLGTSIADTLRVYADDMRVKRRQRAEELASKASIKMTFPLVFCILPPMFIVLLGPGVISIIETFL